MKSYILVLSIFCCSTCIAQYVDFKHGSRYIFAGMESHIKFSSKVKYDSISFFLSVGDAKRVGDFVYLYPKQAGKAVLVATLFRHSRLVSSDSMQITVDKPSVFAAYGGKVLRKLKLDVVKRLGGVVFYITVNDFHWEPVEIQSYRFTLVREGAVVFSLLESSNRYSKELLVNLDKLAVGDVILITDVKLSEEVSKFAEFFPTTFEVQ
jgi:hypothetical protein